MGSASLIRVAEDLSSIALHFFSSSLLLRLLPQAMSINEDKGQLGSFNCQLSYSQTIEFSNQEENTLRQQRSHKAAESTAPCANVNSRFSTKERAETSLSMIFLLIQYNLVLTGIQHMTEA